MENYTPKMRKSVPINKEITLAQFLKKSQIEREFIRVNLKEQVYKLIIKGNEQSINIKEELEKLFNQNPEKHKYLSNDEIIYLIKN